MLSGMSQQIQHAEIFAFACLTSKSFSFLQCDDAQWQVLWCSCQSAISQRCAKPRMINASRSCSSFTCCAAQIVAVCLHFFLFFFFLRAWQLCAFGEFMPTGKDASTALFIILFFLHSCFGVYSLWVDSGIRGTCSNTDPSPKWKKRFTLRGAPAAATHDTVTQRECRATTQKRRRTS